jgi:hypothetical protein
VKNPTTINNKSNPAVLEEFRQMSIEYLHIMYKLYPFRTDTFYCELRDSLEDFIEHAQWEPEE